VKPWPLVILILAPGSSAINVWYFGLVSDVDWRSLYERALRLHRRAAQHSAAHVVSALNAALLRDRALWTPVGLDVLAPATGIGSWAWRAVPRRRGVSTTGHGWSGSAPEHAEMNAGMTGQRHA